MPTATSPSESVASLRDSVHVWLCRLEPASIRSLAESCRGVLSETEQRRADRFLREHDRQTFEIAHALVRRALSYYSGVPASAWSFGENRWGRPEVVGPADVPHLGFSLSHTRGLVACAVSAGGTCGVDVESLNRGGNPLRVARRVLSPPELRDVESQSSADAQLGRFLEYWTLKEAYLKARGVGLSVTLADLSFELADAGIRLAAVDREAEDDPAAWTFVSERPTPTHVLAVALGPPDGPSRRVVLREGLPVVPVR